METALSFLLLGIGYGMSKTKPMPVPFLERDLSISQPYLPETVPVKQLTVMTMLCPLLMICACTLWKARNVSASSSSASFTILTLILAFWCGICADAFLTQSLKTFTARHRPNFFAFCDYAGYRDSLATGNMTAYEAATTSGALGQLSKCRADAWVINDSQRSFPSGHAASAFNGMVFLSLVLRWAFSVPKGVHFTPSALACWSPIPVACWISITRVRDRYHNQDDIVTGAVIGSLAAVFAWAHWRAHAATRDLVGTRTSKHSDAGGGRNEALLAPVRSPQMGAVLSEGDLPVSPERDSPVDLVISPTLRRRPDDGSRTPSGHHRDGFGATAGGAGGTPTSQQQSGLSRTVGGSTMQANGARGAGGLSSNAFGLPGSTASAVDVTKVKR